MNRIPLGERMPDSSEKHGEGMCASLSAGLAANSLTTILWQAELKLKMATKALSPIKMR